MFTKEGKTMKRFTRAGAILAAAIAVGAFAADAHAVSYQIFNHPDGSAIPSHKTVDEAGYVLRLDHWFTTHTFNANHTTLTFNFDPNTTSATITGTVTHNQSGTNTSAYDSKDDVYHLSGTLSGVLMTERGSVAPWYGSNSPTQTYDDMVGDLLADANNPRSSEEQSHQFSDNVARIYFQWDFLELTPDSNNLGLGKEYTGPLTWTETGPPMFLQYRYRLWDDEYAGDEFDLIAGAGWLTSGGYDKGSQDYLFVLGKTPLGDKPPSGVIPEPVTATLALMGLGALGMNMRRRRMA
jgi:hypothetical protein